MSLHFGHRYHNICVKDRARYQIFVLVGIVMQHRPAGIIVRHSIVLRPVADRTQHAALTETHSSVPTRIAGCGLDAKNTQAIVHAGTFAAEVYQFDGYWRMLPVKGDHIIEAVDRADLLEVSALKWCITDDHSA